MRRLWAIIGHSGSGKSTLQDALIAKGIPKVVTSTTRPMREGEVQGESYHFLNFGDFKKSRKDFYAVRDYATFINGFPGTYSYGVSPGSLNVDEATVITDWAGFVDLEGRLGKDVVRALYLDVPVDELRARAASRPDYHAIEFDRRLAADKELDSANINKWASSGYSTILVLRDDVESNVDFFLDYRKEIS